jgi:uncharacterized membrane protein
MDMKKTAKLLVAGAGAVAGFYAARAAVKKRINTLPYGYGIKLKQAITVNCPAEHLYNYWRNVTNLPALFENVLSVDVLDDRRSHWSLKVPGGMKLEWDAEITTDRKNEMIGWRSLDGADLDNAGYVRFERAAGGRGTVVRVALQYNPPAGKLGAAVSTILGKNPESQVREALNKLKQLMEGGEVATAADEKKLPHSTEPVEVASEDSFPASDAPAWTGTTGSVV